MGVTAANASYVTSMASASAGQDTRSLFTSLALLVSAGLFFTENTSLVQTVVVTLQEFPATHTDLIPQEEQ